MLSTEVQLIHILDYQWQMQTGLLDEFLNANGLFSLSTQLNFNEQVKTLLKNVKIINDKGLVIYTLYIILSCIL